MTDEDKPAEQPKLSKAEQLKADNDLWEKEIVRKEELTAREKLGGGTTGNIPAKPAETEDEKWEREAKLRYAGTGLDPTPVRK